MKLGEPSKLIVPRLTWIRVAGVGSYMVYNVVLNASYEVRSCLLLNGFMFPCCFHTFLNNFFVPQVDANRRWVGVEISNVQSKLSMAQ